MIPVHYQLPAAALLILGGLVSCFAGYRFFRAVVVVYGFIFGALIATSLVGAGNTTQLVLAAVGGGIAGAVILYFAYFVGLALIGAGLGAFLVHLVWSRVGGDPHPAVIILVSIAGAAAAMVLQRYVIIAATAFAGAWTLIIGALAVEAERRAAGAALSREVWVVYPFSAARWLLIVWLALGVAGALVQLTVTGRGRPRITRAKAKARKAQAA